jgi:hypothetical protein
MARQAACVAGSTLLGGAPAGHSVAVRMLDFSGLDASARISIIAADNSTAIAARRSSRDQAPFGLRCRNTAERYPRRDGEGTAPLGVAPPREP